VRVQLVQQHNRSLACSVIRASCKPHIEALQKLQLGMRTIPTLLYQVLRAKLRPFASAWVDSCSSSLREDLDKLQGTRAFRAPAERVRIGCGYLDKQHTIWWAPQQAWVPMAY
jgi:hypothetical protein